MSFILLLGLTAATLTTIAFIPQVIKTWKTKSADDLSLGMYSIFCTGVLLWLIYGILIGDIPVIAANTVTLILALTILFFKFFYKE
ncbi:SemiSWEET transporter [Aliifodinibius salicampi]|uniref:SemiSWEET transporter n=1 Tax=Fodinibius salicampi TaxID=1920655 RepID=A0ABT3PYT6_9BACT|nr:SemiSWEET transporter [Fodinibius salicampi]MCW9713008.1 SemiSWEET transporter [Fodinibius salicampi]